MTDQERVEAQLVNIDRALVSIVAVLLDLQPPHAQEQLNQIMNSYFDVCEDIEAAKDTENHETGKQT